MYTVFQREEIKMKELLKEGKSILKEIKARYYLIWLGKRQAPIKHWVVVEE
jgi:hypothetical protein